MGTCMIVAPAARAAVTSWTDLSSMPVESITSATASCRAPPAEVKSFWYSIRTTAVVLGSNERVSLIVCLTRAWRVGERESWLPRAIRPPARAGRNGRRDLAASLQPHRDEPGAGVDVHGLVAVGAGGELVRRVGRDDDHLSGVSDQLL